jgi:hypothetical protein
MTAVISHAQIRYGELEEMLRGISKGQRILVAVAFRRREFVVDHDIKSPRPTHAAVG